jgi:hypothetical protein
MTSRLSETLVLYRNFTVSSELQHRVVSLVHVSNKYTTYIFRAQHVTTVKVTTSNIHAVKSSNLKAHRQVCSRDRMVVGGVQVSGYREVGLPLI